MSLLSPRALLEADARRVERCPLQRPAPSRAVDKAGDDTQHKRTEESWNIMAYRGFLK